MRRFFVPFYSKQHHTTSLLDATDSMRKLYQQRYWTWWTDEMTSVKETPPHLNCQDWIKPSRTASVCTNGKNGETLLKPWTKRQTWPSCGELLKELMAEQTRGREWSYYLQRNLILIVQTASTKFNQQFNTSKLGRHTSSRETRVVTRETTRKPLEKVRTFTTDLVMKQSRAVEIVKAFGPDKLSIFHLKHLGPRTIEYITTLFNLSATTCRIPGYMEVIINHPYTETGQGHLPRNFLPANLVNLAQPQKSWNLCFTTIYKYLIPAQDQHGFRREHSTTSALLQLTTYVAVGFNQYYQLPGAVTEEGEWNTQHGTDAHT